MDNELSRVRRDRQRLFYGLLIVIALFVLVCGLCLGILAAVETETRSSAFLAVGTWFNNALTNIGAGIIIIVVLSLITHFFHITEHEENEMVSLAQAAGIQNILGDWILDKPSNDRFYRLFKEAETVQINGVTLYSTFISCEWFPPLLAQRIKDRNKNTQFLLLDPSGTELARRETEGGGRRIKKRADETTEQILDGLKLAGLPANEQKEYLRFFDYAPTANVLRFDDTAFIVLLMHGKGGLSPALEVSSDGWLCQRYSAHFESMWKDADATSASVAPPPSNHIAT